MTPRACDASLPLEVPELQHLFGVVAQVEDPKGEAVPGQDPLQLHPVCFGAAPEDPQDVPRREHERNEGLNIAFEVLVVQRWLFVGEALPLPDVTQAGILHVIEAHDGYRFREILVQTCIRHSGFDLHIRTLRNDHNRPSLYLILASFLALQPEGSHLALLDLGFRLVLAGLLLADPCGAARCYSRRCFV